MKERFDMDDASDTPLPPPVKRRTRGRPKIRGPVLGKANGSDFCIDLEQLMATRLFIQAASGGGKSYALRRILEQTHGKVQQIIIDPEGELVTLADQYPFLVCSTESEQAPLRVHSADRLAEAIYRSGRSAILSIGGFEMEDMQAFVGGFLMGLMRQPKEHWHYCMVAIDEAQLFAPQQDKAASKKAMLDLASRARKRGICPIVATQRISQLHKGVVAHLDNKLVGLTTLDTDVERAAEQLGMKQAKAAEILRRLDRGEFMAYGPALTYEMTKVKVGPVKTSHGALGKFSTTRHKPTLTKRALLKLLTEISSAPDESESKAASIAVMRRWVIAPLLEDRTAKALQDRCRLLNLKPTDVRRWVNAFKQNYLSESLEPQRIRAGMMNDLNRLRPMVQGAPILMLG